MPIGLASSLSLFHLLFWYSKILLKRNWVSFSSELALIGETKQNSNASKFLLCFVWRAKSFSNVGNLQKKIFSDFCFSYCFYNKFCHFRRKFNQISIKNQYAICLSLFTSLYYSVSVYLYVYFSLHLLIYLSDSLSIRLFVCLSVCLSNFLIFYRRRFSVHRREKWLRYLWALFIMTQNTFQ